MSAAISLSGTLTPPSSVKAVPKPPAQAAPRPTPGASPPAAETAVASTTATATALVVPLLKQLGEVHGQMFEQFQQSMLLMMQMFGQMHRDQVTRMQQELARIQDLNAELTKLQADVANQAIAQALDNLSAAGPGHVNGLAAADTPPPAASPFPLPGGMNSPEGRAALQR